MNRAVCENRRAPFWVLLVLVAIAVVLGPTFFPPSRVGAQPSASQLLAEKFAPIAMLREQTGPCDKKGEGYFPAPVDFLFNNPDILLKADAGGDIADDPVILTGFTMQDLLNSGPNTYMDFPGNLRDPGCTYESYFKEKTGELNLEPTTYARFVVDQGAGQLYLQYWFYYYFNDWNNTHESDWEMVQLVFNATTADEALSQAPATVAYAQHGGGELSSWSDDKLAKDGDRLIVYPSAGSHATYYTPSTFIGWGDQGSAFGCDSTVAPSATTPLKVVLVPNEIDPAGPLAFFLYEGHWGQRAESVFNGPPGPNVGGKWNDPTEAISTWRTSSLKVPTQHTSGLNATDLFCTVSEYGSKAVIALGTNPILVLTLVIGLLGFIGLCIYRVWGLFIEAIDIYGNELRTFLGIGMMAVPIGLLFNGFAILLTEVPPLEWVLKWFNDSTGGRLFASLLVGVLQQLVMILIVVPAVIVAMRDIRRGVKPGVWASYRAGLRHFPTILLALVIYSLAVGVLAVFILLLPLAIYLAVRWQFFLQAALLGDIRPAWKTLGDSWRTTAGQWRRAFALSIGFLILAIVPGPLVGIVILILGGSRVEFANFVSSFVFALLLPLAYIGLTMAYHRLKGDDIVEPTMMTRERNEITGSLPAASALTQSSN